MWSRGRARGCFGGKPRWREVRFAVVDWKKAWKTVERGCMVTVKLVIVVGWKLRSRVFNLVPRVESVVEGAWIWSRFAVDEGLICGPMKRIGLQGDSNRAVLRVVIARVHAGSQSKPTVNSRGWVQI